MIDEIDGRILAALVEDARQPVAALAREVGLSAPSTSERIRRLEDVGVIRGYRADVDPCALGLPLTAYIRIRPMPGALQTVVEVLRGLDAVVACERITGEDCFVARACVASMQDLEMLIDTLLPHASTNTSIVQSQPVEPRLPAYPVTAKPLRGRR